MFPWMLKCWFMELQEVASHNLEQALKYSLSKICPNCKSQYSLNCLAVLVSGLVCCGGVRHKAQGLEGYGLRAFGLLIVEDPVFSGVDWTANGLKLEETSFKFSRLRTGSSTNIKYPASSIQHRVSSIQNRASSIQYPDRYGRQ